MSEPRISLLNKLGEMEQTEFDDYRKITCSTVDEACLASIRNFQVQFIMSSFTSKLPLTIHFSQASGQYDEAEKALEKVSLFPI